MRGSLLVVSFFLAAAGPAPPGIDVAGRVQTWLDSWNGLSGRFEQKLSSPTLPEEQIESGTFHIARPDRMRWDFRRPEKKLAVTDGVHTWLYVPSDRQVIRGRLEDLRRDSAVSLLLSGGARLDESFEVVRASVDGESARLELVPRLASEVIETVVLDVETDTGRVRGFTVRDPSGNRVTWSLFEMRLDPPQDDSLFRFRIPRGVEVQELGAEPPERAGP